MKTSLKLRMMAFLIAITTVTALTAAAQSETNGYSLSISTDKASFASGEAINLTLTLKNIGKENIWIPRDNTFYFYSFHVLLPNKQAAPETLYGTWRFNHTAMPGVSTRCLKPGEQTSTEVPLSRLFDFSLAGNYEISVVRKVKSPDTNLWLELTSSQINVNVDDSFSTHDLE